jgi:hypothetical protein
MLKAGREFVRKNNVLIFVGNVGDYTLTAGALLETHAPETVGASPNIVYKVAYTFCSPKDTPSDRYARGYIGWRLLDQHQHPYVFYIFLDKSGAIIPERLSQLVRLHIDLDIVSKRVRAPARLQREALRGGSIYSHLRPVSTIPRTSAKMLKSTIKVNHVD